MTFRHFRPHQPGKFGSAFAATLGRVQPVQIAPASAPNLRSTMPLQRTLTLSIAVAIALVASFAPTLATAACPFCSAVSQTIRQESEVMDAVLIVFDQDQFEQAAALAYLKYERVWLIQPSQPNTTASPPSIAAYPPTWGVIAADADSLQVLRTPPSPPPSIPLALSELLIDTP